MKIRVHDASDLADLVSFLEERDCIAERVGPNIVDVAPLASVRHNHVRLELDLFLEAWHAAHPEARAELVD